MTKGVPTLPEEMTMAVKKEDVRITKTKHALGKAFFEMLTEMSLEDITVNDLCQKADIRRATFYKHFKDKSDFIFCLIRDARERFDHRAKESGNTIAGIKEYYLHCAESVIDYLSKYDDAMSHVISSGMRPMFIEMFVKQNHADTVARLEQCVADGMHLFSTPEVISSMLIGGVSHPIVHWFENENRRPKEELLKDISTFIDRILH